MGIGHTYVVYTDYIKGWNKIKCYLLEKVTFKELRKTPGLMIGNWGNLKESLSVQGINFIPKIYQYGQKNWDTSLYYMQSNIESKTIAKDKICKLGVG